MSDWKSSAGPVPARWLHCPRKAVKLVRDKFLVFKTPLSSQFDDQIPTECCFNVDMLFSSVRRQRQKLGLWIDLTNTNRFYNKKEVESHGCGYLKISCRGHGETPSAEQVNAFVHVCKNFIAKNPLDIIGVHCTHGFNRSGFLVISYLVETGATNVDAGLAEFAVARPPGIYKADYVRELFRLYDDEDDAPPPPARPLWCLEYDDSGGGDHDAGNDNDDDNEAGEATSSASGDDTGKPSAKRRKREIFNKNPTFMEGVPGVRPVTERSKIRAVRTRVQEFCKWKSTGFPGSQPVSMDHKNLKFLSESPYRVSWKADGTRYMLLIQGDGELYFIDRDNSVFQVEGLSFPHKLETGRNLKDTLLDGEMVIDIDGNKKYPRYLAYDIVIYDGMDVSDRPFYPNRYELLEGEVMGGRHKAMREGRLCREREPFSVRHKHFWDVTQAKSLLSEKFAKQLSHEPDGLIFQDAMKPYTPGQSDHLLKWKPLSLNSIDFKLKIGMESGQGIVSRKIGHLFVGGQTCPYGTIKMTKELTNLDNKIIECKLENGRWVFMRERTDKSFPNSYDTAQSVYESICKPVTTEYLLEYIERHRALQRDEELMPPPGGVRR